MERALWLPWLPGREPPEPGARGRPLLARACGGGAPWSTEVAWPLGGGHGGIHHNVIQCNLYQLWNNWVHGPPGSAADTLDGAFITGSALRFERSTRWTLKMDPEGLRRILGRIGAISGHFGTFLASGRGGEIVGGGGEGRGGGGKGGGGGG